MVLSRRLFLQSLPAAVGGVLWGCGAGSEVLRREDAGAFHPDAAGEDRTVPADASNPDAGAADAEEPSPDAESQDASEPRNDPASLPEAPFERFPLSVASGDAAPGGAVLWTQYAGGAMRLDAAVWREAGGEAPRTAVAMAGDGGFVQLEITGLDSGTWYRFAFVESSGGVPAARSPIGRFRTALEPSALEPVIVAATACMSNVRPRFRTLEQAGLRQDLDLFLLLGDTTYNDGATDVPAYRGKWSRNLAKDGYRALRAATSIVATWDDHEVGNNWNPETIAPAQLAAARQVFFEHLPQRRSATDPDRIWRSVRWGRTLEVFVLDCRSERRPSTRMATIDCQYISREQLDWLKAGLSASDAVFKIIVNSVPIAMAPPNFDLGDALLDPADRWSGYPAQRTELLQHIEANAIAGVIFLSGDYHLAYAGRCGPVGTLGASVLEILGGPGNQFPNPLYRLLRPPQFDFSTNEMNYVALHLDPRARRVVVRFHDESGGVFHELSYPV